MQCSAVQQFDIDMESINPARSVTAIIASRCSMIS